MHKTFFNFSAALLVLLVSSMGWGKDLSSRLGIGYSDQFSTDLPSVAMRYYPDPKLGVGAALGVDTEEDNARFGFMVRLYRVLGEGFMEDNMNFYMGTGAGLISTEKVNATTGLTDSDSGFELTGFCGGEFFLTGLENLGFSFEAGVGVTSIHSEVRFRTVADHPLKAGITFYF